MRELAYHLGSLVHMLLRVASKASNPETQSSHKSMSAGIRHQAEVFLLGLA